MPVDRTRDRLLVLLKTRGPLTTAELARRLDVTPMGARQHLKRLTDEELVAFHDEAGGVGRPARVWRLGPAAEGRFPEGYAELAVDILEGVRAAFGEPGLQRLVAARSRAQAQLYAERMPGHDAPLAQRVAALTRLRKAEGYMAEWSRRAGGFLLVENHCPICAAAQVCQGLCGAELELFRTALGPEVSVEREDHILQGARRCTYRIGER